MAWVSMRRSVPCALRHAGDAANDPEFKPMDRSAGWPHHARRWLAVLLLFGAVTALSLALNTVSARSVPQEFSWRTACLFAVPGDAHLHGPSPRELCTP